LHDPATVAKKDYTNHDEDCPYPDRNSSTEIGKEVIAMVKPSVESPGDVLMAMYDHKCADAARPENEIAIWNYVSGVSLI